MHLDAGCLSFHQGPLPGEPRTATFAHVEGARVRYLDSGGGAEAVVFLHGFGASMDTWAAVWPEIARTRRILALDLKGFGWSDRPPGDYSPRAQASLVLALLDRCGVRAAALVAHSWGASVALAMAIRAPERVTRLALYDAWVYEAQLPPFFELARAPHVGEALFGLYYRECPDVRVRLAFHDKRHVTEKLVEDVEEALARPGTVAAALAAVRGHDFASTESGYRAIRHRTLVLWGRDDEVTPVAFGERLAQDLPDARLVVYPACGHFPMIEAQAASTRDLARFLDAP